MGVVHFIDNLRNALTGTGTGRDARSYNTYAVRAPLSQQEIHAAYTGSGLMRKIVRIPALDMVREWRDWKLETADITAVEAEEKRLGIQAKVRQAETLRRLGGGAMILGLPGDLAMPAPALVGKQGLAFIHVVSRWHLSFDELEDDARLPGYGEPRMWRLNSGTGQQPIHPSRVIPFRGDTTASLASQFASAEDAFWGESTVAQVLDAVKDNDAARAAFASLLTKAQRLRVGIPNLMTMVAGGQSATINERIAILGTAESMHNATIYDAGGEEGKGGETITDATYNFAGAKDVLNAFGEFAAAISDIPATRLLGRAPEGMNSSGEGQQKDWNKLVMAMQTLDLGPCIDRLDRHLVPSAIGKTPDGCWYAWAPLDQPSQKENADRFKTQMEAIEKLANLAAIPDQALNRGVQSLMIDEGYLPELETALAEIPEDERWGIVREADPELEPNLQEGGDPASTAAEPTEAEPLRRAANDAAPRTLYVQRKLLNAAEFLAWAKAQGFAATVPADDLHVTITFSRTPVDWMKMGSPWDGNDKGELIVPAGGARIVEPLGDKGAVVMLFNSSSLSWRHEEMIRNGASHDFPEYQPHVTITYEGTGVDLTSVEPFRGELRFGPEIFEELNLDWKPGAGA